MDSGRLRPFPGSATKRRGGDVVTSRMRFRHPTAQTAFGAGGQAGPGEAMIEGSRAIPRRAYLACFAAILLFGCRDQSSEDRCMDLIEEYRVAMASSLACDPTDSGSCGTGRPLVVCAAETQACTALCAAPCLAAVNPASTAALDEILGRFEARGCTLKACPCPTPAQIPTECVPSGDAGVCQGLGPPPPHLPPTGS